MPTICKDRHVLITGGAGYIGSHAVLACIDAGYRVTVIDNLSTGILRNVSPVANFLELNVTDIEAIRNLIISTKIDAIMHFAGSVVVPESVSNPLLYYQNNTSNSLGLAGLAVELELKAFIFSSTAAVYAPDGSGPLDENALKLPLSPYGHSKLMTEQMLGDVSAAHELPVGILRYFNVAGADPLGRTGQSTPNATHLIKVACEVATGQRDVLPVFGTDYPTPDGTCVRDYIHVSDLADAHVLLLAHLLDGGSSLTANCGYGQGASVLEVVRALEGQLKQTIPIDLRSRRVGDASMLVANSSRLTLNLKWKPRFAALDQIVGAALAWERHLCAAKLK